MMPSSEMHFHAGHGVLKPGTAAHLAPVLAAAPIGCDGMPAATQAEVIRHLGAEAIGVADLFKKQRLSGLGVAGVETAETAFPAHGQGVILR
jgi:hypothetical protein